MALYPSAVKKLIAPGANDPKIIPTIAILHVAVTKADSLHDFFATKSGGIESHFYIRLDGTVEQYRDTEREADANYKANSWGANGRTYGAVSIETAGMGTGEWTPAQQEAIKKLLTWLHTTHGIPLRACPGPFKAGVGYHTMWGAPSAWTPVSKVCPGPDRIVQFKTWLVPWMNAGAKPTPAKPPKPTNPTLASLNTSMAETAQALKGLAPAVKRKDPAATRAAKLLRSALWLLRRRKKTLTSKSPKH